MLQHFTKIADAVDIPQILYNVPSRTASDLIPDTVIKLANHPNIIGIKEAVDDSKRLAELLLISQKMGHQKNFSKKFLSGSTWQPAGFYLAFKVFYPSRSRARHYEGFRPTQGYRWKGLCELPTAC